MASVLKDYDLGPVKQEFFEEIENFAKEINEAGKKGIPIQDITVRKKRGHIHAKVTFDIPEGRDL